MAPTDETAQFEHQASPVGTTPPTGPPAGPGPGAAPSGRMPRWLPRAMVLALALVAVFQLGSWAFHQLIGLLVNILIAFFLALAIEPAVSWMASKGLRRGFATFLVFLITLIGAAGFVTLLGSMLAGQIIKMVEDFPAYLDSVISWINSSFHTELKRVDIQEGLLRSDWLRKYVQNSATGVLDVSAQVLGGLFQLLTIALFSFYFAADGPRLRRALCSVLPPARQAEVLRAWEIAVDKTGGYLYSRGLMALISGAAHYVLLEYLDVPYAPALAVWVGLVSQFIPTIGTYLAGALPMLIAFTVNPWYALWVLVFVVIYQQFENYVLQPKLTAKTVDIHPAVAFGSVVAGTALLGAVGALIAIPAIATLQAFLGAYVKRYDVTDDPRVHGHRRRGSGDILARLRKRPHRSEQQDGTEGDVLTRVRKRLEEKLDRKRATRQPTGDSTTARRDDDTARRDTEAEGETGPEAGGKTGPEGGPGPEHGAGPEDGAP
ncbi:AI-2E family transporter [Streptomyces sp. NBC_00104]|uniref:AI-2E family transporter n=1 Tax=unclassified Streptomyces TaxID=2593676 RepID=UPI002E1B0518